MLRTRLQHAGRFLGWLSVALLLSHCAQLPEQSPDSLNLSANQQALRALEKWQLQGKLGVRLPDDNGSARLSWQQHNDSFFISLSGPLGQGRVEINGEPGRVVLRDGEHAPISAESPEALIFQATGWDLPVSALRYWVLGLPVADTEVTQLSYRDDQLPERFSQLGWQLHFKRYYQQQGLWLPSLLSATTQTPGGENIRLTVAINQWELQRD
ncbi:lipoprotein insertase outer membrane protein LolB [Gilvimarinus sp. DA14]|uniref:lipoprotein insertase outer membrane protein LolB n=1 Tax=Gilvimarinus sp. DA14 TaxID=2956798 RepID=UPI0020B89BA9|nr:lipoprotein insertase outer membrane protein LolB [Gilvimarinus sp. DA14]UTF61322.1 lipoprotein insertase outer membrane protein LolB [Gilvimarinus sp. DA14]